MVWAAYSAAPAQGAAGVPAGFRDTLVAGGLSGPTSMALAPDGRIFVTQKSGELRVIRNGRLLSRPFLKVNPNAEGERGLLGVALDPGFRKNGYVYVYYTAQKPKVHNRISRFTAVRTASGGRGNFAPPSSHRVILDLNNLSAAANHNGGAIHFGEDGKLYAAVGENARPENSQTLRNLLGKVLRINKNGTIPRDNPFYGRAQGKNKAIWALGLRNPYTFAIQPGSGKMYINDVGQKTWEEINHGVKGANYGWPRYEGPERDRKYRAPIFAYRHGDTGTTGCAITGGAFYNPVRNTFGNAYQGDYFFGDFCNGWVRRYDPRTDRSYAFARTPQFGLVDLQVSRNGDLYYLHRATDSLRKISKG
jgi:glucose/arabinose dehydrogenase